MLRTLPMARQVSIRYNRSARTTDFCFMFFYDFLSVFLIIREAHYIVEKIKSMVLCLIQKLTTSFQILSGISNKSR